MDIKKIIREEIENSWDWVEVGETPYTWLVNNFGNLTKLPPNKDGDVYYVNDANEPLIRYNIREQYYGFVRFDYDKIWVKLESNFGLGYLKVQELIEGWLKDVYGLTGYQPGWTVTI